MAKYFFIWIYYKKPKCFPRRLWHKLMFDNEADMHKYAKSLGCERA